MDIFEQFLKEHKEDINKDRICRALTCNSYKKVYQQQKRTANALNDNQTNTELATYGDAVLSLALCKILFDTEEKNTDGETLSLTENKKKYETDKVLIEIIAEHYSLLDYINYDEKDKGILKKYTYYQNDATKYIATTVESIIGQLYQDNNFDNICELVKTWIKLIDDKTDLK